jgi:hypothetical protein
MIHLSLDDSVAISDALLALAAQFRVNGEADGPIYDDKHENIGLVKTLYIGSKE